MIPEWATHIAVDANGEVWAFEGEPVWIETKDKSGAVRFGHWLLPEGYRGLRFMLIGDERSGGAVIADASRLLCVAVPRPEGWSPPERDGDATQ